MDIPRIYGWRRPAAAVAAAVGVAVVIWLVMSLLSVQSDGNQHQARLNAAVVQLERDTQLGLLRVRTPLRAEHRSKSRSLILHMLTAPAIPAQGALDDEFGAPVAVGMLLRTRVQILGDQQRLGNQLAAYDRWAHGGVVHPYLVSVMGYPTTSLAVRSGQSVWKGPDALKELRLLAAGTAAAV